MTRYLFLDTETTGLDIERHEVWEFAAVETNEDFETTGRVNLVWEPSWLENADPMALQVNHYYARAARINANIENFYEKNVNGSPPDPDPSGMYWSDPAESAKMIATLCEGAFIVGRNPMFDVQMLRKFCAEQSQCFAPAHPALNVVDFANGFLLAKGGKNGRVVLPPSGSKTFKALGIANQHEHRAMDDAIAVLRAWKACWNEVD
jgi:DNA polymerase III epsilon subunit-like protein